MSKNGYAKNMAVIIRLPFAINSNNLTEKPLCYRKLPTFITTVGLILPPNSVKVSVANGIIQYFAIKDQKKPQRIFSKENQMK